MRNIYDSAVVKLAFTLKQRNKHGVFTALFVSVLIKLPEKVLVFMLRCGGVHLVFHLKHNRDKFNAVLGALTENVVAL